MSVAAAGLGASAQLSGPVANKGGSDRRADIDAKQQRIAGLLAEHGCEGLLILDQANLAWLTSGGVARSVLDPVALPGLYYTTSQRWLLSSNVESQRMFDEELDGMGFLLKEWAWRQGREQLLTDLCHRRAVASDTPFGETKPVGDQLRVLRRTLTRYEQACYVALGSLLAHALEATCRTAQPGETERELAGQIGHRLYHRGAIPAAITVAADGKSQLYRQHGFTSAPIEKYAVVAATARKYGLHASASRTFTFGPAEEKLQRDHFAACKIAATYMASTWPDAVPRDILQTGKRIGQMIGHEYEWTLSPQGHVTGRTAVELSLGPDTEELLRAGWCVVWAPTIEAASCCDTYLVTENGAERVTVPVDWPMVSVRVSGAEMVCPSILERS